MTGLPVAARRHHTEIVERFLTPFQEGGSVRCYARNSRSTFIWKARGLPNSSIITEWSMTRSTGFSGLNLLRVTAQSLDAVAHGGQIDHGGHAGEILHQARGRDE